MDKEILVYSLIENMKTIKRKKSIQYVVSQKYVYGTVCSAKNLFAEVYDIS